jgi:hypothetical protein
MGGSTSWTQSVELRVKGARSQEFKSWQGVK